LIALVQKFLIILFLFGSSSCANNPEDIIRKWESKDWQLVQLHGQRKPVKRYSILKSETAKAVEASWTEKGRINRKVYPQSNHWILVIHFYGNNGEKFAAVMKKRK